MDEMCRINAARRKARGAIRGTSKTPGDPARAAGAEPSHPRADVVGPAEVLVRLKIPLPTRHREPSCSTVEPPPPPTIEVTSATEDPPLEASYGAEAEDMAELVQAAVRTFDPSGEGENGTHSGAAATTAFGGGGGDGNPMTIVGFSIDVGPACWDDAVTVAAAAVATASPRGRESAAASSPSAGDAAVSPEEAVASAALSESIDAAVGAVVDAARRAVEACAAVTAANGEEDARKARGRGVAALGGSTNSGVLPPPPPSFSFRRLHVTGLGDGGARGEPLAALKAALARHLPTGTSGDYGAVGTTFGRPVVVSADATEHLVAGGVWSTVASIIGRKDVVPAASTGASSSSPPPCSAAEGAGTGDGRDGGAGCSSPGAAETGSDGGGGGAMYYIDDGCYGSLSGALLRGVRMEPSPLYRYPSDDPTKEVTGRANKVQSASVGASQTPSAEATTAVVVGASCSASSPDGARVPCTVWGPTCDGLDCVSRVTPLPDNMEPGRDWLFFPDMGMGAGSNVTGFNGLKPLDACYCIRREGRVAHSSILP